jgi:hypothetical protein
MYIVIRIVDVAKVKLIVIAQPTPRYLIKRIIKLNLVTSSTCQNMDILKENLQVIYLLILKQLEHPWSSNLVTLSCLVFIDLFDSNFQLATRKFAEFVVGKYTCILLKHNLNLLMNTIWHYLTQLMAKEYKMSMENYMSFCWEILKISKRRYNNPSSWHPVASIVLKCSCTGLFHCRDGY